MRVKRIAIALEPDPENPSEKDHATLIEFDGSRWEANGPMFGRITAQLDDIYKGLMGVKEPRRMNR